MVPEVILDQLFGQVDWEFGSLQFMRKLSAYKHFELALLLRIIDPVAYASVGIPVL